MSDVKTHSRGRDERVVQLEPIHDPSGLGLFALTSHGRLFAATVSSKGEIEGWVELEGPLIA